MRLLDWILGRSEVKTPNLEDLNQGRCPACGGRDFYEGPHGGLAVNVKCVNCGSCFNLCPPFTPQRIPDAGCYNENRTKKTGDL